MKAFVFALALLGLVAASPAPDAVVVHISNFRYAPASVTVVSGATVKFVNDDPVAHSVTASDKAFDSGDFGTGGAWTHVFDKPGTYAFYCDIHPAMRGTVVVSAQ